MNILTTTTRGPPQRIVHSRQIYDLSEDDSEFLESLDFKLRCVMIKSRLNLPCDLSGERDPDYTQPISRTAVKHVHDRFEHFCRRFELLYDRASDKDHWGTVNSLIYVLGELCPDSVLCDKFFERLQLFPRLTWLMRGPIRVPPDFTVELLAMVVRRGSDSTRLAVARHANMLNSIFLSHMNSFACVAFNSTIIAHALEAAFNANPQDSDLVSSIPLLSLTQSICSALLMHKNDFTYRGASHALVVLAMACVRHELDDGGIQGPLDFFAALTRVEDLSIRALALRIFLPINFNGPSCFTNTSPQVGHGSFPENLRHLLEEHTGSSTSESEMFHAVRDTFHAAVCSLSRDQDLCKFGSAVAEILQQGSFVYVVLKDPQSFPSGVDGLPYGQLEECLFATVKALRETGGQSEQDIADIVELGRLAIAGPDKARELAAAARDVIARNPQLTFAYVSFTRSAIDREEALLTAQKGLECADTSPCLRRELLLSAMDDSFNKGWTFLICGDLSDPDRRAWGKQYTTAGANYMKELLRDSTIPLDSPNLWLTLSWAFMHAVFSAGSDLGADITRVKNTLLPRLEACESVLDALGYNVKDSPVRRGREAYLTHLGSGQQSWRAPYYINWAARFDTLTRSFRATYDNPTSGAEEEDILYTRWWNVAKRELVPATTHGPLQCMCRSNHDVYADSVVLGRCDWCQKCSAILKQCARCKVALYCDGKCQTQDWPRHKNKCRRKSEEQTNVSPV